MNKYEVAQSWSIYSMDYLLLSNKKEGGTDMCYNSTYVMLRKIRQTPKATCDSIYMKGSDTGKSIETGSRFVVCQGWGRWGIGG